MWAGKGGGSLEYGRPAVPLISSCGNTNLHLVLNSPQQEDPPGEPVLPGGADSDCRSAQGSGQDPGGHPMEARQPAHWQEAGTGPALLCGRRCAARGSHAAWRRTRGPRRGPGPRRIIVLPSHGLGTRQEGLQAMDLQTAHQNASGHMHGGASQHGPPPSEEAAHTPGPSRGSR